ncbi:MAG: secretin and TonB N-terminal domain-containing protein [Polyangiaceae bacterium]
MDFSASRSLNRVTLDVSAFPKHRLVPVEPGRTQLWLEGATLAPSQARVLDVSALTKRVERIACYPHGSDSNSAVVLELTHLPRLATRVEREGSRLVLELYDEGELPSSVTGVARDGGVARRTQTVAAENREGRPEPSQRMVGQGGAELAATTAEEAVAGVTPALLAQQAGERYGGRRINLDLKDADIHNVLRLLAEVGRVNVVTADNVQGNVTIRMRNVPWDQALDVILQAKGLGMVRRANMNPRRAARGAAKGARARDSAGGSGGATDTDRDAPHSGLLRQCGGYPVASSRSALRARQYRRR